MIYYPHFFNILLIIINLVQKNYLAIRNRSCQAILLRKLHLCLEKGTTNGYTKSKLYFNLSEQPKEITGMNLEKEKCVS